MASAISPATQAIQQYQSLSSGYSKVADAVASSDGSTDTLAQAAVALADLNIKSQVAILVAKKAMDLTSDLLTLPRR